MARSDGTDEIWGTREELLLACAVGRHGTRSWASVAMEVRARIPSPPFLTAHTCERRYHDLRRRFTVEARGDARDGVESDVIPVLEELRRLRVAELRREVERYDVSIMSLQLRVQKLKEDRERRFQEERPRDGEPDPPETKTVKKEADRSWNESYSTGPNASQGPVTASDGKLGSAALRAGSAYDIGETEHVAEGDEKVAGEGSYNGSSDTVAKGAEVATPAEEPARTNPAQLRDPGDSGESVAESKGEAAKESSDVQSSASLSRRRRGRRKAVSGGSSGVDEAEADEVSPVDMSSGGESQPLARFLEIIRSHGDSSMFESRLQIQDGTRYRSLILQHMELQMVQAKVAGGAYAGDAEFYRDLLLLFTNAVVFFPRNSAEHAAAVKLRRLVRKQIVISVPKGAPPSPVAAEEPATLRPPAADRQPTAPMSETDADPPVTTLLGKPRSVPSLVACRKRSSSSGKAAAKPVAPPAAAAVKEEEEKPDTSTEKKEAESAEKKKTKETSALAVSRGLRTSKGRGSSSGDAGGATKISTSNSVPRATVDVSEATNTERNQHSSTNAVVPTASVAKKRSAVNLLTRTSRRPAASNVTLLEKLKNPGRRGNGERGEQKKGGRADGKKDQASRQVSGASGACASAKQALEQSVPLKRGVGRPPKRPLPPLSPPPAKRAKDDVPPQPSPAAGKKRGRR